MKFKDKALSMIRQGESDAVEFKQSFDREAIESLAAFANTNGGTIYVGISPNKKKTPVGVENAQEQITVLQNEINNLITPALPVEIDTHDTQNKTVIRVRVPFGEERPYAVENYKIFVRDDSETTQAIRDEIVNLARQGMTFQESAPVKPDSHAVASVASVTSVPSGAALDPPAANAAMVAQAQEQQEQDAEQSSEKQSAAPRAGVEIVGEETRNGQTFYIMRDLRNGNIVKNVTRSSARRLWHYAIKQRESSPVKADKADWQGDKALWRRYKKAGNYRYDLIHREGNAVRTYYGVTDNGMHGDWQQFIEDDDSDQSDA